MSGLGWFAGPLTGLGGTIVGAASATTFKTLASILSFDFLTDTVGSFAPGLAGGAEIWAPGATDVIPTTFLLYLMGSVGLIGDDVDE